MASMISSLLAPFLTASAVCALMQYGHWVTCATATAISCFVFSSSAPASNTVLLKFCHASAFLGARAAFLSANSLVVIGYKFSFSMIYHFNFINLLILRFQKLSQHILQNASMPVIFNFNF